MVNHKVPFPFTDPEKEAVTSCSSIPTHNTTEESHTSKGFRLLPPQGSTIVRISNNASQVFAEENLVRGSAQHKGPRASKPPPIPHSPAAPHGVMDQVERKDRVPL